VFEECGPVRYHKDGQRVYFETNKGAGIDLNQLELFDPATGKEEIVESDPLKRVDIGDVTFSEVTEDLIATSYIDEAAPRLLQGQILRSRLQPAQETVSRNGDRFLLGHEGRAAVAD
jgi:hypothetical protein